MRVIRDDGDRLILSGPPGGVGTVVLLLVVGTAMSGGGALFVKVGLDGGETVMAIMGGLVGLVGLAILVGGIGAAIARDQLELDGVTRRGRWTRRLLGRAIKPAIDFDFDRAKHVKIEFFTETSSRSEGGGSTSVQKVRACLLVSKPRRRIVLDEAERQRAPRVEAIGSVVADRLGLALEGATVR